MEKLKLNRNNKKYPKKARKTLKKIKPLGKPVYGKFLALMIKNHILNEEEK